MSHATHFSHRFSDSSAASTGVAVIALSLLPMAVVAQLTIAVGGDKVAHALAYAALSFLALLGRRHFSTGFLTAAAICYLAGVIELFQSDFVRTTDVLDFVASCCGVALGCAGVAMVRLAFWSVGHRNERPASKLASTRRSARYSTSRLL